MNTLSNRSRRREDGSILAYFILLLVLATALASVGGFVAHTARIAHRRNDMIAARQYAESGAVIACNDLNTALQRAGGSIGSNLATNSTPAYVKNTGLSTTETLVYERTVTAPFTNQNVGVQI